MVCTKAFGPSMERSTCVSAAKLTTAEGRYSASRRSTSARSTDPPLYEDVVGVIRDRRQGARVAGVGQGVEIDHPVVSDRMQDEVAPYKAGAAGDEDGLFLSLQCAPLSWLLPSSC